MFSILTLVVTLQAPTYLQIDLNKNNRIEDSELYFILGIYASDGYEINENGSIHFIPSEKAFDEIEILLPGEIPMVMIRIPSGTYEMESWTLDTWGDRVDLETQFVVIHNDFFIGKYEVTQEQYESITGENPSTFLGNRYPVHDMGWLGGQKFIDGLNELIEGGGFRYPTSTEWQYACAAGTSTNYYWGDDIADGDQYEWTGANSQFSPFPVGLLQPNPWGLHDMQGNLSEFVLDKIVFDNSSFERRVTNSLSGTFLINPVGMHGNDIGYTRGGDYRSPSDTWRSNSETRYVRRGGFLRHEGFIGFRVCRDVHASLNTDIDQWAVY